MGVRAPFGKVRKPFSPPPAFELLFWSSREQRVCPQHVPGHSWPPPLRGCVTRLCPAPALGQINKLPGPGGDKSKREEERLEGGTGTFLAAQEHRGSPWGLGAAQATERL